MHSKTWKKEKDLLSEAYQSVTETTHDNDAPALGPDEERQSDGSVKNAKTGETVYTQKTRPKLMKLLIQSLLPSWLMQIDPAVMKSYQILVNNQTMASQLKSWMQMSGI